MIHILTNTYRIVDPRFGHAASTIELDMGCGKGALTMELACRFPDRLILGADIMLGRLRSVHKTVLRQGLNNVELLRADNAQLAGFLLPDSCLARVHIVCPDPWPKARHRAKRLITSEFLGRIHRILEPAGVLHVATDHRPYLDALRRIVEVSECFAEDPSAIADVAHIQTGFERQWRDVGKDVPHLAYRALRAAAPPP